MAASLAPTAPTVPAASCPLAMAAPVVFRPSAASIVAVRARWHVASSTSARASATDPAISVQRSPVTAACPLEIAAGMMPPA